MATTIDGYSTDWLSSVYFWAGPAPPDSKVRAIPAQDYIASYDRGQGLTSIPPVDDALVARQGPDIYERMIASDPVLRATVRGARSAAVKAGPTLSARYPDDQGRSIDFREPPEGATEDVIESAKALEFCEWINTRLRTPIDVVSYRLAWCYAIGSTLADKTYEVSRDFDGKARIAPIDVKAKHWSDWWHVVDRFNNVDSILIRDPDKMGGYLRVERDKFVCASFASDTDDPGGESALQANFVWWRLKMAMPGQAHKFSALYSMLIPTIEMGPDDQPEYPTGSDGFPDTTKPLVRPEQRAAVALAALAAGKGIAVPHGSKVDKIESSNSAQPFREIADLCDRQNVYGLLGSARATLEAEHGSKADQQGGADNADVVFALIRSAVGSALYRDLYWDALKRNWGAAFADAYCPVLRFADTEIRNFAETARGVKDLAQAGVIKESQFPAVCRIVLGLNLPEPIEDEDDGADDEETPPVAEDDNGRGEDDRDGKDEG